MSQECTESSNQTVDASADIEQDLDQEHQDKIEEKSVTLEQTQQALEMTETELEAGRESLELLYKLSRSLVKVVDPAVVAHDALELITEALSVLRGEVMRLNEHSGELKVLALIGYDETAQAAYEKQAELRLHQGLAWEVAQEKKAMALPDINCSEHWLSIPGLDDEICSAAAVPMLADEKMTGVMTLLSNEYDHLNDERLPLLTAIATQVTLALQNAELFVSEQEARRTSELLREANLEMTKTLDVTQISDISLDYLDKLIHYDQAAVILLQENDKSSIVAYRGNDVEVEPRPLQDRQLLPLDRYPLIQKIVDTEESLLVSDTQEAADWHPVIVGAATRSWIGIPLSAGQEVIGLFTAGSAEPNFFSDSEKDCAETLGLQTATALHNGILYEELQTNRNRLRRLADQLVTVQEAERKRVSRELHDEAGQALNALKISLSVVKDELSAELITLQEKLTDAADLADQTIDRIRFISYDLRPPELDTLGLNAALEEFCEDFAQRTRLTIRYRDTELPELADSIKVSFYRFLQEALTNITKHAEASQVDVDLTFQEQQICLSIADNGNGFLVPAKASSAHWSNGLGLLGMRERFEQIDGLLTIESDIGHGTTITACVPWEPPNQERANQEAEA